MTKIFFLFQVDTGEKNVTEYTENLGRALDEEACSVKVLPDERKVMSCQSWDDRTL